MYNSKMKNEIVSEFIAQADANIEFAKAFGKVEDAMKVNNAGMVKLLVKRFIEAVSDAVPEGIDVEKTTVHINQSGDDSKVTLVEVSIKNKYSSDREFKFKKQMVYSEDVTTILIDFVKCTYVELITDALIRANLEVVNAKLADIGKDAGNTFAVKLVSPMATDGRKVVKITDEEVVFVADETRIFELDDILVFCEPREDVPEELIKKGYDDEVAVFAQAQTTPQFIGVHDSLIGYLCDISKLVKAITLIKKVYSKNVKKLKGKKDSYAYYLEGKVYAVIFANADGKEVVLQPFDTDSLEVVDCDVLANI